MARTRRISENEGKRMRNTGLGFQEFVGMTALFHSSRMRELLALVERTGRSAAAVLITGETGVGKEIIARALHHYSLRCARPWVDVSCAAIPEHLLESELFGYERGAFSGATCSKPGLFELAHGGTLFLDEVAELDRRMQVKLLRVLDGVPYYRLGGTRKISTDVRVLAATNQDLAEAIGAGRFRRDLYHRLSQVEIRVPALRERPEDILPLAHLFLSRENGGYTLAEEAAAALERYDWPGNVRELRNVVSKAVIHAARPEIRAADLPAEIHVPRAAPRKASSEGLDGLERDMILHVLMQTGGHHRRTAELLGISRRTLSRKLKLYRLETAAQPN
jgi:DNA-binding NtrC family response regulator